MKATQVKNWIGFIALFPELLQNCEKSKKMEAKCNGPVSNRSTGDVDNNDENRADNCQPPPPAFQNDGEHRIAQLACQVFEIDVLRERILTHVIQDDDPDIASIRLVQKRWMKDVSTIMKKLGKPLYKLELNENNSLNGSDYVRDNGAKALDHFISTIALSSLTIENVIPPFSLSVDSTFFKAENRQSFSDFFTGGSAAGLVELKMNIPANGGSMDLIFYKIPAFPILRKLGVQFCEKNEDQVDDQPAAVAHGSNSYFLPFLQTVLRKANELKKVVIQFTSRLAVIPAGVQHLALPTSLTNLELRCVLTSTQLEGLGANSLPNLTTLTLPFCHIPFSNNLIFRILNQYKKTLRQLFFIGLFCSKQDGISKVATHFKFPVMERLEVFSDSSIHAELEPDLHGDLQICLPKLKDFWLVHQTVEKFRKWTVNSCYAAVTELTVGLVNENGGWDRKNCNVTIRLEEMQTLHLAFPNVSILEIDVTGEETCGLKYLFMEMKQLNELTIIVLHSFKFTNSYHWDSLLTGIPFHIVKTLGVNPQFWEYVISMELKADKSTLRNLNALRSLTLSARLPKKQSTSSPPSLISDAVFHLAFLKMPNLKALSLEGQFKASARMTRVWEAKQRSITYCSVYED